MEIFLGVFDVIGSPVKRALEPVNLIVEALGIVSLRRRRTTRALVEPVRRNAVLSLLVHLVGTNLNLERARGGTNNRGMQRLIVVELGHGDVVLEAPWHGVPQGVHRA